MKMQTLLKKSFVYLISLISILMLTACADSGSDDSSSSGSGGGAGADADVTMKLAADYGGSSASIIGNLKAGNSGVLSSSSASLTSVLSACIGNETTDGEGYASGLDCDGDGGTVAYTTPTQFKVAIRKLSFFF